MAKGHPLDRIRVKFPLQKIPVVKTIDQSQVSKMAVDIRWLVLIDNRQWPIIGLENVFLPTLGVKNTVHNLYLCGVDGIVK